MSTITATIRLEGADEVKSALSDIGAAGDEAFQKLGEAAQTIGDALNPLTGLKIDFSGALLLQRDGLRPPLGA
jgi:nitrogen regulatory protein PII